MFVFQIGGDINVWKPEIFETLEQKNKEPKQIMYEFLYFVCNTKHGRKQLKTFIDENVTTLLLTVWQNTHISIHTHTQRKKK